MSESTWHDLGSVDELSKTPLRTVTAGKQKIALSYANGVFGAIHNACNHSGGPLGEGALDGDFVVCPWHNWKFHRLGGQGEPGY